MPAPLRADRIRGGRNSPQQSRHLGSLAFQALIAEAELSCLPRVSYVPRDSARARSVLSPHRLCWTGPAVHSRVRLPLMRNASLEVLVVGAGPVGSTMAAELARHGVSCRIIDRLPTPLPYCRAIGITPRTLEVWDDMGIADPLHRCRTLDRRHTLISEPLSGAGRS